MLPERCWAGSSPENGSPSRANNIPEWLLLGYGCALANLTLVTVNPASRPPELAYVLGRSGSSGVFLFLNSAQFDGGVAGVGS